MNKNIVDIVCEKANLVGRGHYTRLARAIGLGVTKQHVNGWKKRNKIPEALYPRVRELTQMNYDELVRPPRIAALRVPLDDFSMNLQHYLNLVRRAGHLQLTEKGKVTFQISVIEA